MKCVIPRISLTKSRRYFIDHVYVISNSFDVWNQSVWLQESMTLVQLQNLRDISPAVALRARVAGFLIKFEKFP